MYTIDKTELWCEKNAEILVVIQKYPFFTHALEETNFEHFCTILNGNKI